MKTVDKDRFYENISKFNFVILKDDGLYRHIKFGPHQITTWPGYLCVTGDMGTYVFSRLQDMFEFFRLSKNLDIDYRYWAEKCRAEDTSCKIERFDADKLIKIVEDTFSIKYENPEECEFQLNYWKKAAMDVCTAESGYRLLDDLCYDLDIDRSDNYEFRLTSFSYQFMWVCNLLAVTISKYDAEKINE